MQRFINGDIDATGISRAILSVAVDASRGQIVSINRDLSCMNIDFSAIGRTMRRRRNAIPRNDAQLARSSHVDVTGTATTRGRITANTVK